MRRIERSKQKHRIQLFQYFRQFQTSPDGPLKLLFFILYGVGAVFTAVKQGEISDAVQQMELISPVVLTAVEHILPTYLIGAGLLLLWLFLTPFGKRATQDQLMTIGMVNHGGMAPELKRRYQDKQNPRVTVWEFTPQGIPLKAWEDKQPALEAVLDVTIIKLRYSRGKSRILLYTVSAQDALPELILWQKSYLSEQSFQLILGESYTGPVQIDLTRIPHILLGGSTGSGKSVLLKLLLMQAVQKGAEVYIADFKGGVDFPPIWHETCQMCIQEQETLDCLNQLTEELQRRKLLLTEAGVPNIDCYPQHLPRLIFACDEIAEVLDKTGASKEQKERIAQIENRLSIIARQGRAFGIHLILATQRPDANILSGQIKNNVNCRICGRADTVLSQIILDSTAAAEQIPKDATGRFLLHDGTVFQAYWFKDEDL